MPIYSYRCQTCGRIQDELRKMKDADVFPKCNECLSLTKRILTPPSIVLKGPDWARNG